MPFPYPPPESPSTAPAVPQRRSDAPWLRHVVVIGAGIVGAACAIEALRAGHRVTLVDPYTPGGQEAASYGNAGWLSSHSIIPPAGPDTWKQIPAYLLDPRGPLSLRWRYLPQALPWLWRFVRSGRTPQQVGQTAHALRALLREAPALHRQLAQEAGVGHLIEQRGLLHVYASRRQFEADALGWRIRAQEGVAFEVLDAAALRAREPDLAPDYKVGVLVPEAGHCRNPGAYLSALVAHAQALGARLVIGRASGLRIENGRLQAVLLNEGHPGQPTEIACQAAVLAAGAYSAPLAEAAGDAVWLDTERGYHVMLDGRAAGQAGMRQPIGPRTPTMFMDHKLIVHQMEHGLRVAGQVEIAGLHAAPDWRRAAILREHVFNLYPGLPRSALESRAVPWMGRRPSTPDGLPCIGTASASLDVIHAYGHGHVGLTGSARTGRIVAQLLAGAAPEIDLTPFSPQRWRR